MSVAIPVPKERQLGFQDHSALGNIMSSWEAPTRWMPTLTCIESELEAKSGGGQHLHGSLIAVFKILGFCTGNITQLQFRREIAQIYLKKNSEPSKIRWTTFDIFCK
ncbi:hypothetical protein JTB14_032472 [Gonioctena quinquepunctata]|nr:hypothetical protein JTB14_032472 [Gonioctena quinquepunctata]